MPGGPVRLWHSKAVIGVFLTLLLDLTPSFALVYVYSRCTTLKHGSNSMLAGALLCTFVAIGQLIFTFLRVRQIRQTEVSYGELKTGDDGDPIHGADEDEAYFSNQTADEDGEELVDHPV